MNQKLFLKLTGLFIVLIILTGCPRDPDMDGLYDPDAEQTYVRAFNSKISIPDDYTHKGYISQILVGNDYIYGLCTYSNPSYDYNYTYWRIFKFDKTDKSLVGEVSGPDYSAQPSSIIFTIEKDKSGNTFYLLFQEFDDSSPLKSYKILIYDKDWLLIKNSPTFFMDLPNSIRGFYDSFAVGLISSNYLVFMYYYSAESSFEREIFDTVIIDISSGMLHSLKLTDGSHFTLYNFACDGGFLYTTYDLEVRKYQFVEDSISYEFLSSFSYSAESLGGIFGEGDNYNSDCISVHNGRVFFFKNNYIRSFWAICGAEKYSKTLYSVNLETEVFEAAVWGVGSFSFGGNCASYTGISGDWSVGTRFFMNGEEIVSSEGGFFIPKK
ncbi:MAG: hypothetical protein JXR63_09140 [Spirochaetales bacterium]|nr:hypothetical protein [Spirochaetales bacterium]